MEYRFRPQFDADGNQKQNHNSVSMFADQTTATARRATPITVTVEARAEEQLWLRQAAYNLGSQGLRGAHQGKQGG